MKRCGRRVPRPQSNASSADTTAGRRDRNKPGGRQRDAPARESRREGLAPAREPRGDGAFGPVEFGRGLGAGLPVQVAQHDRGALRFGQRGEFVVDDRAKFGALEFAVTRRSRSRSLSGFADTVAAISRLRRRAAAVFAFRAVRTATPYSHPPTAPGGRIVFAFRARTRNAAWNASSASCASASTRRHTPSTIDP